MIRRGGPFGVFGAHSRHAANLHRAKAITAMSNAISEDFEARINAIQETIGDYAGLARPESRRRSDEALRKHLRGAMEDFLLHVHSLETYLGMRVEGALRSRASEAVHQIEMLLDKLQLVPYEFSPFFVYERVPSDLIGSVLDSDGALLATAAQIQELLAPTLNADSDFKRILNKVFDSVSRLDTQIEARINAIMDYH